MPAHLVTSRRQVVDRQNPQAVEQVTGFDAKRGAKIFEAENIAAADAGAGAFEPVPDLDKLAAALAVLRIRVPQVASNRIFQNREQKFQLTFYDVISPDQVSVLPWQQKAGVDCFFVR
jgi:hypothetical protein